MDEKTIRSVNKEIYRKFPDLTGVSPQVSAHRASSHSVDNGGNYLLTYHRRVKTADNKSLDRMIRVVIDSKGKILKITTSH